MFRTPSLRNSISVALTKLLRGVCRRGSQAIYKLAKKGAGSLNIRNQISSLRNIAFCVWEGASLWAHWIHSFHRHLGYLGPNPVSLFILLLILFPQLLSNHLQGASISWFSFGSPRVHLEARNRWWPCYFLFIDMKGDVFISQVYRVSNSQTPLRDWSRHACKII